MTKKDKAKLKRKADKEKKRQAKEASIGTATKVQSESGGSSWAEKQEAAQAERKGKRTKVVVFPK